jgi:hypothetical protein
MLLMSGGDQRLTHSCEDCGPVINYKVTSLDVVIALMDSAYSCHAIFVNMNALTFT